MARKNSLIHFYNEILDADKFLSISYLTKHLNISMKTVYNYIKELEYEVNQFEVLIEKKKPDGIRIICTEKERNRLRSYLINDRNDNYSTDSRRKDLMEILLMRDEKVSVRKLEEKYGVAKSSVVNDLEYVDKQIQKGQLFLVRDKSGTYVSGKEQHIRSAKRNFVYELFKEKVSAKESYDLNICREIIKDYVKVDFLTIATEMIDFISNRLNCAISNDVYYNQLLIQFSVFLDRIDKQHFLVSTTRRPVVSELHKLKTYPVSVELCAWLEEKYHIKVKSQDIRWLNARVSGAYHENTLNKTADKIEEVTKVLYEFTETISTVVGENLLDDEVLMKGLEQHLVPMFTRITNKIQITNPFLPQIKLQYPALFSALLLASSAFENSFGMHVSDDEISFILIHFQAAIERLNLSKKIAIVIHSDGASAALVENRVKRNLPRFDVVETFYIDDLQLSYLEEFDFIISTTSLDYDLKPVILISPLVDDNDVRKIHFIYQEMMNKSNVNIVDLLVETLDEKALCLKTDFVSKKEVLTFINEILVEHEYVVDGFLESMLKREELSPTELGNGIAIPHGVSKYVMKEKIIVLTLKKPILWEKEKVDIIFCLAINFKDKERSRMLISNIYRIIKKPENLNGIRLCKTRKDFISVIKSL